LNAPANYELAGLGTRFVAAIIDLVLLLVVAAIIFIPFVLFYAFSIIATGSAWYVRTIFGPFEGVLFLLFVIYFTFYEGTSGQTIGKRMMHVKVVRVPTGQPPSLLRALVRNLLRIIDWLPVLYILGFLVSLLNSRRQRLGDLVADTVVIRS